MEEKEQTQEHLLLVKHFEPGAPGADGVRTMTTGEVYSLLDDHAPGKLTSDAVYDALLAAGFTDRHSGIGLVWDLIPRRSVRISPE